MEDIDLEPGEAIEAGSLAEPATFQCPVCMERAALGDRNIFNTCGDHDHGTCRQCAFSYVLNRVNEARIHDIRCPVGMVAGGCSGKEEASRASEAEVLAILREDKSAVHKFHRFNRYLANKTIRECPERNCGRLCEPVLVDGKPEPEMHCIDCGAKFCYLHSWAHKGADCTAYAAQMLKEEKTIGEKTGAKSCPGCCRQTQKSGGCNHMTCVVCKCHWCWLCGENIDGRGASHYRPEAGNSCTQFGRLGEAELRARRLLQSPTGRWRCVSRSMGLVRWLTMLSMYILVPVPFVSLGLALSLCGYVLYALMVSPLLLVYGLVVLLCRCTGRCPKCADVCKLAVTKVLSKKFILWIGAGLFIVGFVVTALPVLGIIYALWIPVTICMVLACRGERAVFCVLMNVPCEAVNEMLE